MSAGSAGEENGLPKEAIAAKRATVANTVTETTTIVDKDGNKKTMFKTVTNLQHTWKQMSRTKKWCLGGYLGVALLNLSIESYRAGKSSLVAYREHRLTSSSFRNDWDAVRYGCSNGSFERFWSSVVWPCTVMGNIMPNVVLLLNPAPRKPPTSPTPPKSSL